MRGIALTAIFVLSGCFAEVWGGGYAMRVQDETRFAPGIGIGAGFYIAPYRYRVSVSGTGDWAFPKGSHVTSLSGNPHLTSFRFDYGLLSRPGAAATFVFGWGD